MITRFLILFIIPLFVPVMIFAQLQEGTYLKIDYLKVDNSEFEPFLNVMKSEMKKLQQQRINNDKIIYWRLYKVSYPGNRSSAYNFVTVTTATSPDPFENESMIMRDDKSNEQFVQIIRSLQPFYTNINSELWIVRNSIQSDSLNMGPARYVTMDYMEVAAGREFEYRMLEDEIAAPLHRERMNIDRMDKWEMYELIVPGGTKYGYNFATGNFFNRLWHIEFGFTEDLINQTHPDTDITSLLDQIVNTRDLVQHELWELVDFVY